MSRLEVRALSSTRRPNVGGVGAESRPLIAVQWRSFSHVQVSNAITAPLRSENPQTGFQVTHAAGESKLNGSGICAGLVPPSVPIFQPRRSVRNGSARSVSLFGTLPRFVQILLFAPAQPLWQ